jgi:hypothetical protein
MLTNAETAKLIKLSQTLWRSYTPDDDLDFVIETWREMFADWSYDEVAAVLKASKGEFMPSLPTIRTALERKDDPPEDEALRLAHRWWRYLEQSQYRNGSGYAPVCPVEVPESIRRVVETLGGAEANLERFRDAWRRR